MNGKKLVLGIIIGGIFGVIVVLIMVIAYDRNKNKKQDGFQIVADSISNEQVKLQQILVYGDYANLDSTDYLLIPLGMQTVEIDEGRRVKSKSAEEYLPYDESFKSYKYNFSSFNFTDYNNIVFYNKKTDSTHILLYTPAIISQFYFPCSNENYTGKKYWFLLMAVREIDTNTDGYINSLDEENVYIADMNGKNKVQISPNKSQLIDWFVDEETNSVLLKIREDSNKDNMFTVLDDIEIVKISIYAPGIGKEIISKKLKMDISRILRKIK